MDAERKHDMAVSLSRDIGDAIPYVLSALRAQSGIANLPMRGERIFRLALAPKKIETANALPDKLITP